VPTSSSALQEPARRRPHPRYAETSDSWAPLATELVKTYTVIVPRSARHRQLLPPAGGYDKKTQAADIRAVVTTLGFDRTFVVSHDIGIMVAYAYAALYPTKSNASSSWTLPSPASPLGRPRQRPPPLALLLLGHRRRAFVQGRERIYLDRIWTTSAPLPLSLTN